MTAPAQRLRGRRRERGFTLIELLVAVAILGLLMSLSAGLLHLGGRSWDKSNRMSEDVSAVESAQSLLRLELARARLAPDRDTAYADFRGAPDSIAFRAPLPQSLDGYGPAEIRIESGPASARGRDLVMEWRLPGAGAWTRSVILPDIASARFSFYGPDGDAAAAKWQSNWVERKSLPQAVRLDIELPAGDGRYWPAFVVDPMVTTDLSCLHNTAGQC